MPGEILSIKTASKIARLEKDNAEMSDIIVKYDLEIARLYNSNKRYSKSVTELKKYLNQQLNELDVIAVVDDGTYSIAKETFIELLKKLEALKNDN